MYRLIIQVGIDIFELVIVNPIFGVGTEKMFTHLGRVFLTSQWFCQNSETSGRLRIYQDPKGLLT